MKVYLVKNFNSPVRIYKEREAAEKFAAGEQADSDYEQYEVEAFDVRGALPPNPLPGLLIALIVLLGLIFVGTSAYLMGQQSVSTLKLNEVLPK